MKQEFYNLQLNTDGQKLYEFTDQTIEWINKHNFKNGILNLKIGRAHVRTPVTSLSRMPSSA